MSLPQIHLQPLWRIVRQIQTLCGHREPLHARYARNASVPAAMKSPAEPPKLMTEDGCTRDTHTLMHRSLWNIVWKENEESSGTSWGMSVGLSFRFAQPLTFASSPWSDELQARPKYGTHPKLKILTWTRKTTSPCSSTRRAMNVHHLERVP